MDLSHTKAISQCQPQRQLSTKTVSSYFSWQQRPMHAAKVKEKLWYCLPCRQRTKATAIRRTVLHATEIGCPLYLRLGYQPTGKFIGCTLEP